MDDIAHMRNLRPCQWEGVLVLKFLFSGKYRELVNNVCQALGLLFYAYASATGSVQKQRQNWFPLASLCISRKFKKNYSKIKNEIQPRCWNSGSGRSGAVFRETTGDSGIQAIFKLVVQCSLRISSPHQGVSMLPCRRTRRRLEENDRSF